MSAVGTGYTPDLKHPDPANVGSANIQVIHYDPAKGTPAAQGIVPPNPQLDSICYALGGVAGGNATYGWNVSTQEWG